MHAHRLGKIPKLRAAERECISGSRKFMTRLRLLGHMLGGGCSFALKASAYKRYHASENCLPHFRGACQRPGLCICFDLWACIALPQVDEPGISSQSIWLVVMPNSTRTTTAKQLAPQHIQAPDCSARMPGRGLSLKGHCRVPQCADSEVPVE